MSRTVTAAVLPVTLPAVPLAVWCGAPNGLVPELLCRHLDGHDGPHGSDPDTTWTEETR